MSKERFGFISKKQEETQDENYYIDEIERLEQQINKLKEKIKDENQFFNELVSLLNKTDNESNVLFALIWTNQIDLAVKMLQYLDFPKHSLDPRIADEIISVAEDEKNTLSFTENPQALGYFHDLSSELFKSLHQQGIDESILEANLDSFDQLDSDCAHRLISGHAGMVFLNPNSNSVNEAMLKKFAISEDQLRQMVKELADMNPDLAHHLL